MLAGCAAAPPGRLQLGWQLADHRDCASAGVAAVEASAHAGTLLASFRCGDGAAPSQVALMVPGQGTLTLDGRSPRGALLYRGQLSLDDDPPGGDALRTVTLYAVAAE